MSKIVDLAKKIADNISSPWGEGATYHTIFNGIAPKLAIKRKFGTSHLDDDDWKQLVEDIVYLVETELSNKPTKEEVK